MSNGPKGAIRTQDDWQHGAAAPRRFLTDHLPGHGLGRNRPVRGEFARRRCWALLRVGWKRGSGLRGVTRCPSRAYEWERSFQGAVDPCSGKGAQDGPSSPGRGVTRGHGPTRNRPPKTSWRAQRFRFLEGARLSIGLGRPGQCCASTGRKRTVTGSARSGTPRAKPRGTTGASRQSPWSSSRAPRRNRQPAYARLRRQRRARPPAR